MIHKAQHKTAHNIGRRVVECYYFNPKIASESTLSPNCNRKVVPNVVDEVQPLTSVV